MKTKQRNKYETDREQGKLQHRKPQLLFGMEKEGGGQMIKKKKIRKAVKKQKQVQTTAQT